MFEYGKIGVMNNLATALLDTATTVTGFGACAEEFDRLSDDQVVEFNRAIAECERRLGSYKTHAAAQLARRSRRDLGHSGLAARNGFSSPEKMLQDVTKSTGRQAAQLVTMGRLLDQADAATRLIDDGVTNIGGELIVVPWQEPITRAVAASILSIDCGDALRRGLGLPTERVTPDVLRGLAELLILEKPDVGANELFKAARLERDLVDLEGIQARQQELYDRGGIRFFPKPDGMWQLTGQVDPESAAILCTALDPYTSSRRGGPRFTNPEDIARAQTIVDDPRTTERLALDGLLELVKLGAGLDPQKIHPKLRTLVKVVTIVERGRSETKGSDKGQGNGESQGSDSGGGSGVGFGILEANGERTSEATIDRSLCDGDSVEIMMTPEGTPLNLGRTTRLYTQRQREVLAVRDGGCLWPGCDRPPAFTEAHHTRQWKRDRGSTNVDEGCLLCRFHHMQLHNNGWEIQRREIGSVRARDGAPDGARQSGHKRAGGRGDPGGGEFWLIPPEYVDARRTAIRLESKSALMRYLTHRNVG